MFKITIFKIKLFPSENFLFSNSRENKYEILSRVDSCGGSHFVLLVCFKQNNKIENTKIIFVVFVDIFFALQRKGAPSQKNVDLHFHLKLYLDLLKLSSRKRNKILIFLF